MKNLAGNHNCDECIKDELLSADIPIIELGASLSSEVPASIIGYLNGFTFKRAWYYWVVDGNMPLEWARYLYDNYKDLNIRVAGNCTNPPPEEWAEPKDFQNKIKPICDEWLQHKISSAKCNTECDKIRLQGDQFVTLYHIDTQAGLCKFVKVIRDNKIKS